MFQRTLMPASSLTRLDISTMSVSTALKSGSVEEENDYPRTLMDQNPDPYLQSLSVLALSIGLEQSNVLLVQGLDLLFLFIYLLHLCKFLLKMPWFSYFTFLWSAPKWSFPIFKLLAFLKMGIGVQQCFPGNFLQLYLVASCCPRKASPH